MYFAYSVHSKKIILFTNYPVDVVRAKYGFQIEQLTAHHELIDEDAMKRHLNMVGPKGYEIKFWIKKSRAGFKHSDETRRKMSEAKKGRARDETTKKKISETMKGKSNFEGKKHSEETKRKMARKKYDNKHAEKLYWAHNPRTQQEIRVKDMHRLPVGFILGRSHDWYERWAYFKLYDGE